MNKTKKTVKEHIENLIDFYKNVESSDERLKKLIVRNLQDIKRRYEKESDKNKELLKQNEDMKALFNIQASIAKELEFNTNEKMIRFKDEYYVPDTMAINASIGEPKTLELRYISATKYLNKSNMEEI